MILFFLLVCFVFSCTPYFIQLTLYIMHHMSQMHLIHHVSHSRSMMHHVELELYEIRCASKQKTYKREKVRSYITRHISSIIHQTPYIIHRTSYIHENHEFYTIRIHHAGQITHHTLHVIQFGFWIINYTSAYHTSHAAYRTSWIIFLLHCSGDIHRQNQISNLFTYVIALPYKGVSCVVYAHS